MQLLLEIVSPQGSAMGANRRKTVGAAGVRIGREGGANDWVLNSEYVSRQHAIIRCVHGLFYVEAKSSALTSVNDRARPLAKDEAQPLRVGDILYIDEYEIHVREAGVEAQPASPVLSGLLDDLVTPATSAARPRPEELISAAAPDDVLDLIGGAPHRDPPVQLSSHSMPVNEPSRLDELFSQSYSPEPIQRPPHTPTQPGALDDEWFKTSLPKSPVATPRPARPQPAPRPAPPPSPPVTLHAPVLPTAAGAGDDMASQILAGTGLDPGQHALRPEVLRQFGAVLRTVVDGTMQVLQARSEIKDAFRLPETRIARSHNNPLKFSVDGADALYNLLVKRNDAYLDTEAAFEDAFDDIRFHQLAMLKGMQAGFERMLEHFDPAAQQKRAERATGSGGLGALAGLGGRKGRLWDEHVASYQALAEDRDDAFRRLFGDAFGQAYEEELRRLKTMARATRRGPGGPS